MSQDKTTGTRKGGLQETSLHKLTQRKQRVLSYPGQFQMRLALTLTNSCKNKCLKYCRGQKCGFLDLSYLSRDLDRFHRLATVISGLNTAGSKSTWKNVHMHRGKKNSKRSGSGLCTSFALEVNWLSSLYGLLWKVPARQYTAVEKSFQSWIRELRCAYNRRVYFAYPFNVGQMNHLVS